MLNFYFLFIFIFYTIFFKKKINNVIKFIILNFISMYIYIYKINNINALNFLENDFWYLVEVLNNNNKSVLLFITLLVFNISLIKHNNTYLLNKIYLTHFNIIFFFIMYANIKTNFSALILKNQILNSSLINGVVLIHPLCVYYTYILFIIIYILNSWKINFNINNIKLNKFKIILISFVGLFLGGFWAQQELNWGGWWNWDFVEIIALIFNILALYITHFNLHKNYNTTHIIYRNFWYYIFCFFFFVRVDILNSIHSFNSIAIKTNYKFFIFLFAVSMLFIIIKNYIFYSIKFCKNNNLINIVSLPFKSINTLFLLYFIINLFFIFYLNYQFLDITKFIKTIILLLVYVYTYVIIFNRNIFYISVFFAILINSIFYYYIIDFLIILNIIFFYKTYYTNKFDFVKMISHFLFIVFIFYIKYNINQIYNNFIFYYISDYIIINNNYIILYDCLNSTVNYNNSAITPLYNYYLNSEFNKFYFNKHIYVNNILIYIYTYIIYNLDNDVLFVFYKIHIFLTLILIFIFNLKKK